MAKKRIYPAIGFILTKIFLSSKRFIEHYSHTLAPYNNQEALVLRHVDFYVYIYNKVLQ